MFNKNKKFQMEVIQKMLDMGMTEEEIEKELMKTLLEVIDEKHDFKDNEKLKDYKEKYGIK